MKKIIITFTIFILGLTAIAQDTLLVNKHGSIILPQKGDLGIGISANPFLSYFGNMFNGNTNNSLNLNDQLLYFRYFLSSDAALRLTIRINTLINANNYYVTDDAARALDPLSLQQVNDRLTTNNSIYQIRFGYEKFRGQKRLRGFYGADLGYSFQNDMGKYQYGNQMNELNPRPTTNWGNLPSRTLEFNNGATNIISLGIFTGAEYYLLPKISLGMELGLIFGKSWESQSYTKGEKMVQSLLTNYDLALSPGNSSTNISTSFPYSYGNLYLVFHF